MADLYEFIKEDDWAAPRRLAAQWGERTERLAFMLIRPDTVCQGMVPAMFEHLRAAGFLILDAEVLHPHPRTLEELYRYTQARVLADGYRIMWWYTLRFYELAPAIAVLAEHADTAKPAARVFAESKGPSNPMLTEQHHMRGKFRAQNIVMCCVHSSDGTDTMLREACLFFGLDRVVSGLRRSSPPVNLDGIYAALRAAGVPQDSPGFRDNFHRVLARTHVRILRTLRERGIADTAPEIKLAETLYANLAADGYLERTRLLAEYAAALHSAQSLQEASLQQAGEHEAVRLLHWSARMYRTGEALAERVIARMEEYGCELDPYDKVLLETGFAFHEWMAGEYTERTGNPVITAEAVLARAAAA